MRIHPHTKKQIIAAIVMVVIFVITVLYSKGYFDFTFIDRQSNLDFSSNNSQQTEHSQENKEDLPEDDQEYYYDEEYEEEFPEFEDNYQPPEDEFPVIDE